MDNIWRQVEDFAYTGEEFRPIVIEGKSFDQYLISNRGRVFNKYTCKFIKPWLSTTGYYRVTLYKEGARFKFFIHRLIATAFVPIPKELILAGYTGDTLVVNHINGIKTCNDPDNLEWTTIQGNTIHAFVTGLADNSVGENSHLAKMTNAQAIQCCEMLSRGIPVSKIAAEIGVSASSVQHIKSGECWKVLASNYTFPKIGKAVPYTVTDEDIHEMCKMLQEKKYYDREIAERFNVSREYVRDIRNRKRRQDISCLYIF